MDRNSCSQVFCKIGVLKNFAKFTGKCSYAGFLFLKKLQAVNRLSRLFSCKFCEMFKNNSLIEHFQAIVSVRKTVASSGIIFISQDVNILEKYCKDTKISIMTASL